MASKADRAGTYAQRLIENDYVQENLMRAADNLQAAYHRATKRRVEPTRDEKLRRQVRQAALSLQEAARALQTGRRKPKKRRGRRMLVILVVAAGAAAAVVASSPQLRKALFGGNGTPEEATATATTPANAQSQVAE
jgi:hypothetical protein